MAHAQPTDADGTGDDAEPAKSAGGTWLTYRYRFGGEGTPEATGTMKAPTFLSAARRILARGLGAQVGPAPAYLRLRAAGEREAVFRVTRAPAGSDGAPLRIEVAPGDAYDFPGNVADGGLAAEL